MPFKPIDEKRGKVRPSSANLAGGGGKTSRRGVQNILQWYKQHAPDINFIASSRMYPYFSAATSRLSDSMFRTEYVDVASVKSTHLDPPPPRTAPSAIHLEAVDASNKRPYQSSHSDHRESGKSTGASGSGDESEGEGDTGDSPNDRFDGIPLDSPWKTFRAASYFTLAELVMEAESSSLNGDAGARSRPSAIVLDICGKIANVKTFSSQALVYRLFRRMLAHTTDRQGKTAVLDTLTLFRKNGYKVDDLTFQVKNPAPSVSFFKISPSHPFRFTAALSS